MTGIWAETECLVLPMTEDVSALVDETFGGSKVGPDAETGALTVVEAGAGTAIGTCIGTEVGAKTRVEAGV